MLPSQPYRHLTLAARKPRRRTSNGTGMGRCRSISHAAARKPHHHQRHEGGLSSAQQSHVFPAPHDLSVLGCTSPRPSGHRKDARIALVKAPPCPEVHALLIRSRMPQASPRSHCLLVPLRLTQQASEVDQKPKPFHRRQPAARGPASSSANTSAMPSRVAAPEGPHRPDGEASCIPPQLKHATPRMLPYSRGHLRRRTSGAPVLPVPQHRRQGSHPLADRPHVPLKPLRIHLLAERVPRQNVFLPQAGCVT